MLLYLIDSSASWSMTSFFLQPLSSPCVIRKSEEYFQVSHVSTLCSKCLDSWSTASSQKKTVFSDTTLFYLLLIVCAIGHIFILYHKQWKLLEPLYHWEPKWICSLYFHLRQTLLVPKCSVCTEALAALSVSNTKPSFWQKLPFKNGLRQTIYKRQTVCLSDNKKNVLLLHTDFAVHTIVQKSKRSLFEVFTW